MTVLPAEDISLRSTSEVEQMLNSEDRVSSITCSAFKSSESLSATVAQIGSLKTPDGDRQMRLPYIKWAVLVQFLNKEGLCKK